MLDSFSIGLVVTLVFDALVRLGLVARIVMRRGSVPVSLAWMVVLLFAPIVGAILYLLVGETRLGRRRLRRHARVLDQLRPYEAGLWREKWTRWPTEQSSEQSITRLATAATGLPPVSGNRLELLVEGAFFDRLIRDIDEATDQVNLQTYIWMTGGVGDRVAGAIIDARSRGVTCRVLVDGVGSRKFLKSETCRRLRAAGAEVVEALPANLLRLPFARLDLRNHRKLAVIDGRIAHLGSHNLTDESFRVTLRPSIGPWLDASIRVEGPAAQAAQLVFLQDWLLDAPGPLEVDEHLIPDPDPVEEPGTVVQIIPSGPGRVPAAIHDMMLASIWSARRELILTTPYFVPDEATRTALRAAALRGIDVTLVVPERLDGILVALAGAAQLEELLDVGVKVVRHQRGLLHAKTLTVDRSLAVVGSVNLDMRSFWLNFELTLLVPDEDFASYVAWMQTGYIEESVPMDGTAWRERPVARRLIENLARLLGPLL